MKYNPPLNEAEDSHYVDANPAIGIEGSTVGAKSIEHPMREIVNVITGAGLTPDENNLTQLKQAIDTLIAAGGVDMKANRSLDNLDTNGEARFTGKANTSINNLTQTGIDYIKSLLVIPDNSISTAKLKTALGLTTTKATTNGTTVSIAGGRYSFTPRVYQSLHTNRTFTYMVGSENFTGEQGNMLESARVFVKNGVGSTANFDVTVVNQYITASGTDYWLFILANKNSNSIIGAYGAPDHPAYGNGGDYIKTPHPFSDYDEKLHDIILVDMLTIQSIKNDIEDESKLLDTILRDYKIGITYEYTPLHSGKYFNDDGEQVRELVTNIPDYIKFKTLVKLSNAEKQQRENDQQKDEFINLKTLKLNEINRIYEQKAELVKVDVPPSEVSTWYIQENEATEWSKDNTKPTPFIDGLAGSRQVDRLELIGKILAKVNAYKTFMGNLTGQRQFYEDHINKATTKQELEVIEWN